MIPARIPTQAENAWAVNDARRYAAVQATRFDLSARPPIATFAEPVVPHSPAYQETRVCIYFVIAAAFIFAARYMGVFA